MVKVGLAITSFFDEMDAFQKRDNNSKGKSLGEMIKKNEITKNFFTRQEEWRTGEIIDKNFVKSFIKKAAQNIAEEKY